MSFSHASVLNLANIARDSHINRKTVENYLHILEDLLLGFRIEVFTKRAKRELAAHPKFFSSTPAYFERIAHKDPWTLLPS